MYLSGTFSRQQRLIQQVKLTRCAPDIDEAEALCFTEALSQCCQKEAKGVLSCSLLNRKFSMLQYAFAHEFW